MKRQVWEVQSHTHDAGGSPIFTPDMIEKFLKDNNDRIVRWAWCLHDKDVYTEEDVAESAKRNNGVPTVGVGQQKPNHIHLMLEFKNDVHDTALAKEFGLTTGQIKLPTVKYHKMDALTTYLTHESPEEQEKGKHRYEDSEIHANFDFRKVIDGYLKIKDKAKAKKMKKADVDSITEQIVQGAITMSEIKEKYGVTFYFDHEQRFLRARREFMQYHYKMMARANYYIDGPAGRGKTTLAEMFARSLVPELEDANEAYLVVGEPGVRFQNYEYQPILIWEDVRAGQLIHEFGREGVLNLLETHPRKRNYNIKYDGVILTNQVNIFTGIESYEKFFDGLAGEYVDKYGNQYASEAYAKEQVYRRFPAITHLYPQDIVMQANRGVFAGTDEYLQYDTFATARVNMLSVNKHYTLTARESIAKQISAPMKAKHDEYMRIQGSDGKVYDVDEAPTIEVAVGLDACKEMEQRTRVDYERFVQKWLAKHNASLQKEALATNPRQRTPEEIGRSKVFTFEEWMAAGRPSEPGEGYIDTYAEIAAESLARQREKEIERDQAARREADEAELERLEAEYQLELEEEAERFFLHASYMQQLEGMLDDLKRNPTQQNFKLCVKVLHDEFVRMGGNIDHPEQGDAEIIKKIVADPVTEDFRQFALDQGLFDGEFSRFITQYSYS